MTNQKKILVGSKWQAVDVAADSIREVVGLNPLRTLLDGSFPATWDGEGNFRRFSAWLSDPPAKIPAVGARVRITEVEPGVCAGGQKVGDELVVALAEASERDPAWLYVRGEGRRVGYGVFCRVEELPAEAQHTAKAVADGTRVRVTKICEADSSPSHRVGDVVISCRSNVGAPQGDNGAWLVLCSEGMPGLGTWCEVEELPAVELGSVWATEISRYEVVDATPGAYRVKRVMLFGNRADGQELGSYSEQGFADIFKFHSAAPAKPERRAEATSESFAAPPAVAKPAPVRPSPAYLRQQQHLRECCRIVDACAVIGPNALGLLADIADRLVLGAAQGDFESPRNWQLEAYEEDLDGIVYRAIAQRQRAAGERQ